ncbi:MAG: ankyrin repeat domain-containing protein [Rhodocyclaceae bacterium]|nr:ankyrin repeat domain-containing protein [Rhodocyclaceae bacterium]
MYHPHRSARLAAALLLSLPLPAAWAQGAVERPATVAASSLPDATTFRVKMELGSLDQARAWLDAGLDPDFMGDRIGSGLMIAAWEGNIPLMELFAGRGADVNRTNRLGETALMHAAWKGRKEAVRWLLAHGARVEREARQWTALHYAVFAGHGEVADLLLERGADINARSPNGSSVLMMAVYEGREDMARRLLARGADSGIKNENGDGALEWAMKFNHTRIARLVATTPDAFREAAAKPKADWGQPQKSEAVPKDIEDLLDIREILAARHLSVDKIDRGIAALRAKYARASLKHEEPPPVALEISATRAEPRKQRVQMVPEPAAR